MNPTYYSYPGLETTAVRSMRKSIANEILIKVSLEYGVTIPSMQSKNRHRDIVTARQVAMYLLKMFTGETLHRIGIMFGGRHHSSIIHAIQHVRDLSKYDMEYRERIEKIAGSF